jgi:hypothetical protein
MRLLFTVLLFIWGFSRSFSQEIVCCDDDTCGFSKIYEEKIMAKAIIDNSLNNNNQYLSNWSKGDILFVDGAIVKNVFLRYNAFTDQLMWLREPEYRTGIIYKPFISGFKITDKSNISSSLYKKTNIKNWYSADSLSVFLKVLAEGPISLYIYEHLKKLRTSDEMFQDNEYILLKGGTFHKLKANRLSLFRLMGDDKPKMKSIVRSQHLKVRKEDQLIKAIELYNKSFEPALK